MNEDCSENYPIGHMIERYDIEREKDLLDKLCQKENTSKQNNID